MSGDKTVEEPLSIATIFENLNTKFQNATHVVEDILGVDIPSTKQEVETALQDNLNNLKDSAQKIQAKVSYIYFKEVKSNLSALFCGLEITLQSFPVSLHYTFSLYERRFWKYSRIWGRKQSIYSFLSLHEFAEIGK